MKVLLLNTFLILLVIFITWRLWRAIALFAVRNRSTTIATANLPTVSVCIPARNEMHALTECLERVLASDYEKLEILVFDDSSADDTSVLIKSFAHEGVRFVPGTHLPDGWLGKNHALQVLAGEASGSLVIFMDVDTRIEPSTIRRLVGVAVSQKLDMVSAIPRRADMWRLSVVFGTLRYFWQLVMPGAHYPATSSALWVINRKVLLSTLGGFISYSGDIEPEAHIARRIGIRYRCLLAAAWLGVSFEKKWLSQCETSRRLLYPQFGGKWWSVVLGFGLLVMLNMPTVLAIHGSLHGFIGPHFVSLLVLVAFMATYGLSLTRLWVKNWFIGALLWPYIIFQELILFILSVWGYASHSITWKGRAVAAPTKITPASGDTI